MTLLTWTQHSIWNSWAKTEQLNGISIMMNRTNKTGALAGRGRVLWYTPSQQPTIEFMTCQLSTASVQGSQFLGMEIQNSTVSPHYYRSFNTLIAAWMGYLKGMVPVSINLKFLAGCPALTDTSWKKCFFYCWYLRPKEQRGAFKPGTNNSKLPAALIAGILLPAALGWHCVYWSPVLVWAGIHSNHENFIPENSFFSQQLVQFWVQQGIMLVTQRWLSSVHVSQGAFCAHALPARRCTKSIAGAGDPNWPKGYSTPQNTMPSVWTGGRWPQRANCCSGTVVAHQKAGDGGAIVLCIDSFGWAFSLSSLFSMTVSIMVANEFIFH